MKIPGYVFILLPIIELIIFIEIGSYIGSLNVIISIILTIFLGYYLIKSRIKNISIRMLKISNIQDIYQQYTSSIYSFLAGLLLIIPGYITDVIGLLLLFPFMRPELSHYFNFKHKSGRANVNKDNIIDGKYRDDD
jgi:UPF0716 protein FxsA|tara:strand:- start:238 stop:645 length:408 start_codon:yes stop_codon:yes gene_type:complete